MALFIDDKNRTYVVSERQFKADKEELAAYRDTGLTPDEVRCMKAYQEDPAPLPFHDDGFSLGQGLLEDDGYDPALEAMERKDEDRWSK